MAGNPNWVKGVSGNPGGRSKDEVELKRIIMEKTEGGLFFVDKLLQFIQSAREHSVRLAALVKLMEYGYGKPRQQVEVTGQGGDPIRVVIETGVIDPEPKSDDGRSKD